VIRVAAWSHVGQVRTHNEDTAALPGMVVTGSPPVPVELVMPWVDGTVFAVIDGMGGHAGGTEASMHVARGLTVRTRNIAETVRTLNRSLYEVMARWPALSAMGATVAGVCLGDDQSITVFNVGDARVYRHVAGYSSIESIDDRGRYAQTVTQSIGGTDRPVAINVHENIIRSNLSDRFLLCTDGLSELVSFADIQRTLNAEDPPGAVLCLVNLALAAGAPDNVTAIVVDVGTSDDINDLETVSPSE
jgi:PPM family protein phosphatase